MTEKSSISIFDENYREIEKKITEAAQRVGKKREDIILLAATKTVAPEVINHAMESGIKYIGENRVQEFLSKEDALLPDAHRHFIGHLQTNKVKDIIGKVEMIQSVHSEKLASVIGKLSSERGIVTDILLEVNIGNEESKSGFLPSELASAVEKIASISGVRIRGLMAIPPICEKKDEIMAFFSEMHNLFIDIDTKKIDNVSMEYLSMGMSGDYYEAILSGSNIIRLGTALFGQRNYN
ncbi:MAG: YggS family pyridoxal phosphate-dependent enzyme [Clostridia bacterium]|jgi:pyridoxal phosphate enzyme (YggS family)|nr:YggS family pyridoxal phosphate-dependent enzyme [Clostridia bacterium]